MNLSELLSLVDHHLKERPEDASAILEHLRKETTADIAAALVEIEPGYVDFTTAVAAHLALYPKLREMVVNLKNHYERLKNHADKLLADSSDLREQVLATHPEAQGYIGGWGKQDSDLENGLKKYEVFFKIWGLIDKEGPERAAAKLTVEGISREDAEKVWRSLCPLNQRFSSDEGGRFASETLSTYVEIVLLDWFRLASFLKEGLPVEIPELSTAGRLDFDLEQLAQANFNPLGYVYNHVELYKAKWRDFQLRSDATRTLCEPQEVLKDLDRQFSEEELAGKPVSRVWMPDFRSTPKMHTMRPLFWFLDSKKN